MIELRPTLQPLQNLIGTWKLSGRFPDSEGDTISGESTIRPILCGAYIEIRAHLVFGNVELESLEIIHFDEAHKVYRSMAYAFMEGKAVSEPVAYEWDVEMDGTIIHRGAGATYRGKFNADDTVLNGSWRPDEESDHRSEVAYDATMTRVS